MVYRVLPFADFWLDCLNPGYRLKDPNSWDLEAHTADINELYQAVFQGEIELKLFSPYWYIVHTYVYQQTKSLSLANQNLIGILSLSQGSSTPDLSRALEDIPHIQNTNPQFKLDSADAGLLLSARLLQVDCILSPYDRPTLEALRAENPILQKGYVVPIVDLPELLRLVRSRKVSRSGQDQICVFDRDNRRTLLPQGATVIDFAYAIHTKVGHKCQQARVNGNFVALETPLRSGDRIEILKGVQEQPQLAWLTTVVTPRAKKSIEQWHRLQQMKQLISQGQAILQSQVWPSLKLQGKQSQKWLLAAVTQTLNFQSPTDLLHALGRGHLTAAQVIRQGHRHLRQQPRTLPSTALFQDLAHRQLKPCQHCQPLPPDLIIGTAKSPTSVIRVHRQDCPHLQSIAPERRQSLSWERRFCTVDLHLKLTDRPGNLHKFQSYLLPLGITLDIRQVSTKSELSTPLLAPGPAPAPTPGETAGATKPQDWESTAMIHANVSVADRSALAQMLQQIRQAPGVEAIDYRPWTIAGNRV